MVVRTGLVDQAIVGNVLGTARATGIHAFRLTLDQVETK